MVVAALFAQGLQESVHWHSSWMAARRAHRERTA
jgi:hypothetical protein